MRTVDETYGWGYDRLPKNERGWTLGVVCDHVETLGQLQIYQRGLEGSQGAGRCCTCFLGKAMDGKAIAACVPTGGGRTRTAGCAKHWKTGSVEENDD
jgi:hypothetical protein